MERLRMDRRDFLKMVGTVVPAWGLVPMANAQSAPYTGKILVRVWASGGMDSGSFCDPRNDVLMNDYARAGTPIGVAGDIRYAPMADNANFFNSYGRYMMVLNGVNHETNSHDDGSRNAAVGSLMLGYPNLSELFAAKHAPTAPFSWLSAGGFNMSVGLKAATPVPDQNTLRAMTRPNANGATSVFMKDADLQRVYAAAGARMAAQQASGTLLPRENVLAGQFGGSTGSRALMQQVASFIPATFDTPFTQAHVALIAAQAGIASTINLASGGMDAHSNITNTYNTTLVRLTDLIRYVWQKSADLGIENRIVMNLYSDFSRTPLINGGNGKDHWSIGSEVIMEANPTWGGGKVVGASTARHAALKINPSTGAVDDVNGVVIRPRHVQTWLRSYLGITSVDPKYDLRVPANEVFDFGNPAMKTGYAVPL